MIPEVRYFVQNRIFANNEDQAAMLIRDQHREYEGKLTIISQSHILSNWHEYMLELVNKERCPAGLGP